MVDTIRIVPIEAFDDIQCPWCGHPETLPTDLEGMWQCEVCDKEFWITPMKLIATKEPLVIKNSNGDVIAVQLPIWVLAMDLTYNASSKTSDNTNS
jgi:hypothetical protein